MQCRPGDEDTDKQQPELQLQCSRLVFTKRQASGPDDIRHSPHGHISTSSSARKPTHVGQRAAAAMTDCTSTGCNSSCIALLQQQRKSLSPKAFNPNRFQHPSEGNSLTSGTQHKTMLQTTLYPSKGPKLLTAGSWTQLELTSYSIYATSVPSSDFPSLM